MRFRVSPIQRQILQHIAGMDREWSSSWLIANALHNRPADRKGPGWRPLSTTERASLARSLRRLEQRGLISKSPTGCLAITPVGYQWLSQAARTPGGT